MLTQAMQSIIKTHSMGFVATVSTDNTPNVSPKGMMLVLDDNTLIFGEVRSPGTLRNIANNPQVEINHFDMMVRKAVRTKGIATVLKAGTAEFNTLIPKFTQWGALAERIKNIVKVDVTSAKLITSPAYDVGSTEEELHAHWNAYYSNL